jgi:phage terminase large subunit-like protein
MGRRWGKTVLGLLMVLLAAKAGARVAWVVPTYRNGNPLWRAAEAAVGPLKVFGLARTNRNDRLIEFPGSGGFLAVYSADNPDAIRGEWFHLVVLDEAARIAEEVWTDVIQPTLADVDGDAVLISTPKGRNWFWREWQRGMEGRDNVVAFRAPSSANPNPRIKRAYELAKTRVPERTFQQEWDAEFLAEGEEPFAREWHEHNRVDLRDTAYPTKVVARYISWDTAEKDKQDNAFSACVVGDLLADYTMSVRRAWKDRMVLPVLVQRMARIAAEEDADGKLSGVIIEDKASGTGAYQTLSIGSGDARLSGLLSLYTPTVSKEERWALAGVWCRNGSVRLPLPGEHTPWLYTFEQELFERGEFVDYRDAFAQLILSPEVQGYLATGLALREMRGEAA